MIYTIVTSKDADEDIAYFKKNEINAYNKAMKLFEELQEHPRTGTGKPELMKHGNLKGLWSRRITDKHRIVYSINDGEITVFVLSARSHYGDK